MSTKIQLRKSSIEGEHYLMFSPENGNAYITGSLSDTDLAKLVELIGETNEHD